MEELFIIAIMLGSVIAPFYFEHGVYYASIIFMGLGVLGIVIYLIDFNRSKPGNKLSGIVLLGPIFIILINFIIFLFADAPQ